MATLEPIIRQNFLEYASYAIVNRAIPDIVDGLKPVQRRILQTLFETDDGRFHKVANIIGETMKLHPHGDASIGDALVVLANKEYFIEKQGNFGNVVTGHPAAAARYIECRLTDLARETLFNKELTTYQESYDGRKKEPVCLPVKLPVLLMLGTEGIAVGMSTRILPHNLPELLHAQIQVLEEKPFEIYPDFPTGGIVDLSEYEQGRGKVRVRARLEADGDKRIVVREIPYSTTTESIIASIESAAQKGKVKISSISDFTTDQVEIEINLPRGVRTDEVIPQLYVYTDCEVSISSNIVAISDRHPVELSAYEILTFLTEKLRQQIKAELEHLLGKLFDKQHWLTLEQIFIEKRVYKRIEEAGTQEKVLFEVHTGMAEYADLLLRELSDEDVDRLLEIRIKRISKYDIDKNRQQLQQILDDIAQTQNQLENLTQTTIEYLEGLLKKYGKRFPRRSRIESFESVDPKAVARQNIKVAYDPESGYFGTEVKKPDNTLVISEYDLVLFVCKDGTYRIVGLTEKILIPGRVLVWELFSREEGRKFTVVYRDKQRTAYAKKVHIHKFIKDKEYELIQGKQGKIDYLLPGDCQDIITAYFVPSKRQRITEIEFDLGELKPVGVGARGSRISPKKVARMTKTRVVNPARAAVWDESGTVEAPQGDTEKVGSTAHGEEEKALDVSPVPKTQQDLF